MKIIKRLIGLLFLMIGVALFVSCEPNINDEQLLQSSVPAENTPTPSPTNIPVIATPSPEELKKKELIGLAQQLSPDDIEVLNAMIQFPEYDDLYLVKSTIEYKGYTNLSKLILEALKCGVKNYSELADIAKDVLPAPLPSPKPLTPADKELIISQFLNSEGNFTDEQLLLKEIPKYDTDDASLSLVGITEGMSYSSDDPMFEINEADFEAVFLFSEGVADRNYCVVGISDINEKRMVTIIEIDGQYISCLHKRKLDDYTITESDYCFLDFDSNEKFRQFLDKYVNSVLIAHITFTEVDIEKYIDYERKYDRNDNVEEIIAYDMVKWGIYNPRAKAGASLLKSMWIPKKINYEKSAYGTTYIDTSALVKKIMNIETPKPNIIQNYNDVLPILQAPDSIALATILFRNNVELN
jgi:hypothetical protein